MEPRRPRQASDVFVVEMAMLPASRPLRWLSQFGAMVISPLYMPNWKAAAVRVVYRSTGDEAARYVYKVAELAAAEVHAADLRSRLAEMTAEEFSEQLGI